MADVLDAFVELRGALVVLTAQLLEFGVLREVLCGGVDARLRRIDVARAHTGLVERHQCGLVDVDARAAEAREREGAGELRVELVGDRVAGLVAVAADRGAERGEDARGVGALGLHHLHGGADDAFHETLTATVRGGDHAGNRVGEQHGQAVRGEYAERDARLCADLRVAFDDLHGAIHRLHIIHGCGFLRARSIETERTVGLEVFVDVDGTPRMHLVDQ